MKKIYVTGASGMLGSALVPLFSTSYKVRGTDLPEFDITDSAAISQDIASFSPDIVIHLASMTDVDGCETDPEAARRVNRDGTENVAIASAACGATMVYISTGMIYNGRKPGPYIEYDMPDPVNKLRTDQVRGRTCRKEARKESLYIQYLLDIRRRPGGQEVRCEDHRPGQEEDQARGSRRYLRIPDIYGGPLPRSL